MKFYKLRSTIQSPAHYVELKSGKTFDRMRQFFVEDATPGQKYIPPIIGYVQEGVTLKRFLQVDFFPCDGGIPFFSRRFVDIMGPVLSEEMEFHEGTLVHCEGATETFFAGKTLRKVAIIDYDKSRKYDTFYRKDIGGFDWIAREEGLYISTYVVTQRFVDFVKRKRLKVGFWEIQDPTPWPPPKTTESS